MRESPPNPGLQGYNGTVWGTITAVDDSKMMQRVDIRGLNGETFTNVERPQNYGETSVPLPPNGAQAAEVAINFRGANRSHPVVVATDDRRYRMKNLKPGERASHDDQGQYSHLARDGHVAVAKNHSITAGSQPDTGNHEVNDQLKGLEARMNHMEHSHAGLFDVTSIMRQILQPLAPGLAAIAPILNQDPTGLTKMTQAIESKFPSYLQQHIGDALAKFLSPTITGVDSILGGADTIISVLEGQIANLISANPIVSTVDGLVAELSALQASASPAIVASMTPVIQGMIDSATATNPIIEQVLELRNQLSGLISAAGPGLSFLGPQQRLPQGLSRSLKLSM